MLYYIYLYIFYGHTDFIFFDLVVVPDTSIVSVFDTSNSV